MWPNHIELAKFNRRSIKGNACRLVGHVRWVTGQGTGEESPGCWQRLAAVTAAHALMTYTTCFLSILKILLKSLTNLCLTIDQTAAAAAGRRCSIFSSSCPASPPPSTSTNRPPLSLISPQRTGKPAHCKQEIKQLLISRQFLQAHMCNTLIRYKMYKVLIQYCLIIRNTQVCG